MSNFPFPKAKIPDPDQRLPFIYRQFVDPCDAPITVWIEAFWPAFLHAIITWYQVDLLQIVRTMWKPPLMGWRLRGGRHGGGPSRSRRGGFRSKFGKIVGFDPNDYVGNALNPFADEEMVMLLPGEIFFWTSIEVLILFFFEYQIYDISTAFLYEWTSGVSRSPYCHARDDAVLLATAPGYPLLGIFGWDPVGILDASKQRNIDFFNGFGVAQSVGVGVVAISCEFENVGGGIGPAWIECRLSCLTGPRAGSYAFQRMATGDFTAGSGGCTYDMSPGEVWIGELRVNGSWQISNPKLWCHARANITT